MSVEFGSDGIDCCSGGEVIIEYHDMFHFGEMWGYCHGDTGSCVDDAIISS